MERSHSLNNIGSSFEGRKEDDIATTQISKFYHGAYFIGEEVSNRD